MGLCYWDEFKDFFEAKLKNYFFIRRSPLHKVQNSSSTILIWGLFMIFPKLQKTIYLRAINPRLRDFGFMIFSYVILQSEEQ